MADVIAVVGLGFGDEGKGSMVDAFVRKHASKLVVRFNGGAQAAHHVVTDDGKVHCFSQIGAGALAGADTHLSRYMLVNPVSFLPEVEHLAEVTGASVTDVAARVTVEREALVTTYFHQYANRYFEEERGDNRHGSTGMGIGETRRLALAYPGEALRVGDLTSTHRIREKLDAIRNRYMTEFPALADSTVFKFGMHFIESMETAFKRFARLVRIVDDSFLDGELRKPGTIVFEGAQGVLLDQDYGFQPYTTWTDTTFSNMHHLLATSMVSLRRIGVLRAITTRHGAGPLPTEDKSWWLDERDGERNGMHEYAHAFRVGYLDLPLMRYAVDVCPVDELAVTHLDTLFSVRMMHDARLIKVCDDYDNNPLAVRRPATYEWQEEMCRALAKVKPRYERVVSRADVFVRLEAALGRPVTVASNGPAPRDKVERR